MPFNNCSFTDIWGQRHPVLPVKIINPDNGKYLATYGLIDTGAIQCAIPAKYARILGHKLKNGKAENIFTGSGKAIAYSHTTAIEFFHPDSHDKIYKLPTSHVHFVPRLPIVLLGVIGFLDKFIVNIHYPRKIFFINSPRPSAP